MFNKVGPHPCLLGRWTAINLNMMSFQSFYQMMLNIYSTKTCTTHSQYWIILKSLQLDVMPLRCRLICSGSIRLKGILFESVCTCKKKKKKTFILCCLGEKNLPGLYPVKSAVYQSIFLTWCICKAFL